MSSSTLQKKTLCELPKLSKSLVPYHSEWLLYKLYSILTVQNKMWDYYHQRICMTSKSSICGTCFLFLQGKETEKPKKYEKTHLLFALISVLNKPQKWNIHTFCKFLCMLLNTVSSLSTGVWIFLSCCRSIWPKVISILNCNALAPTSILQLQSRAHWLESKCHSI